jgi:hypothetical protein
MKIRHLFFTSLLLVFVGLAQPMLTYAVAWVVSDASYDSKSLSSVDKAFDVSFNTDGTKMYVLGGDGSSIVSQYTLSSPWDVSTASYVSQYSFSSHQSWYWGEGIFFKSDGTTLYYVSSYSYAIYQLTLSTPWDITTLSYTSKTLSISGQDSEPAGIAFNSDGTKMYMIGNAGDSIYQYTLSSGWDLATASYDSVLKRLWDAAPSFCSSGGLFFKDDGTKMYAIDTYYELVAQFTLGTPWNLATASYDGVSKSVASQTAYPTGVYLGSSGQKLYVTDYTNDKVYQYSMVDSTIPTITSISSSKANGSYKAGEVIDIDVNFSEAVTSTGSVTVTLETGDIDRTCTFTVTNSSSGTCDYTIQAGDTSSDLNATISGTITDQTANPMVSFTPGTSLATNKALVIDTTAPTITSVSSDTAAGTYKPGDTIDIDVTFSQAVTSTGNVTATLETGDTDRTCTFTVSGVTTGTCNYIVQSGDTSTDLNATISGTIADAAGNAMASFTPATSLATNEALVIDGVAPTVSSFSPIDGATGVSINSNLVVNFSENVDVETGNITIKKSDDTTVETISLPSAQVTGTGTSTITIDPSVTLLRETDYYVLIDATAFDDAIGNSYAGIGASTTWNFTTEAKLAQTITFGALAAKSYGASPFDITASSSSGLTVSYASSNTDVATVSGATVTVLTVGSTTITASQAGNANYNAASSVEQTLVVNAIVPTLTSTSASSITTVTASSGGSISSNGGATVTSRGVCISASINPTILDTCTSNGTGSGSFTSSLTSLTASTAYHLRAYATNSAGTAYGSDTTFTTMDLPPTISAMTAVSITSSGATITWTTDTLSSSIVQYGPNSALTVSESTAETNTEPRVTSHSIPLSSLLSCTTYYYKAKSTGANSTQTVSSASSFTTAGCTASAEVVTETVDDDVIPTATGGSIALTDGTNTVTITVPLGYNETDSSFQIQQISDTTVLATTGTPSGYIAADDSTYNFSSVTGVDTAVTTFDVDLTVSISYSDADVAGITESSLRIFYWGGSSWTALSGCSVNETANSVTCTTNHFSTYGLFGTAIPVATATGGGSWHFPQTNEKDEDEENGSDSDENNDSFSFTDVIKGAHKNSDAIYGLYEKGVIKGYSDGTFKPELAINRAELIKMLVAWKINEPDTQKYNNCFPDVTDEWFAPYVCYAKEEGWIEGYLAGDYKGHFKPALTASKAEAMKMLLNALAIDVEESQVASFEDVNSSEWYAKFVAKAAELGALEDTGNFFNPGTAITRGSLAESLYRLLVEAV